MPDPVFDTASSIPPYPDHRPLESGDKPLLDREFARLQPRVSELTFASLYLFRHAHDYCLTMVEGCLTVLGKGYGGEEYFLPPLGGEPGPALERLLGEGRTLYGADDVYLSTHLAGTGHRIVEDRDSYDYLYLRSALAELAGNRYHKKKNRINYFAARHAFLVELYAPSRHLAGCLELLEEWRRVRMAVESASLPGETEAAAEGLRLAEELGLQGVVVLVEGRVKGFALGEQLNGDTSVCHFEKADPFLEGLYQLVNREFCRLLFTGCTFVNREQDLGEPNLREAKLSYHPVELVKKYRCGKGLTAMGNMLWLRDTEDGVP